MILFLRVLSVYALDGIALENQVIMESEWMPTKVQTQAALVHVFNYITNIKANTDNLHLIDSSEDILKNINNYRVQLKGIIKDNKQIIYCNFFPVNSISLEFVNWKENLIYVYAGGFWFWQIEYDLQSERCFNFAVNGDA